MLGLNPYVLGGVALAWLLSAGGAFWAGHNVTHNAWMAEQAEITKVAADTYRSDAIKLNQIARKHVAEEQAHERIVYQPIFRTLTKVVDRPVYRSCAVDADGLRLLNAAIAGTAPDRREPDGTVQARDAAGRSGDGRAAAEGHGTGAAPQPVR